MLSVVEHMDGKRDHGGSAYNLTRQSWVTYWGGSEKYIRSKHIHIWE